MGGRCTTCLIGRGGRRILSKIAMMRVVVRNGFSMDLADRLLGDVRAAITHDEVDVRTFVSRVGFHH